MVSNAAKATGVSMRFVPSLLLACPLLLAAQAPPVTAELQSVAIRLGAGMAPKGQSARPVLSGTLRVTGLPQGSLPRFHCWQVPAALAHWLEQGRLPAGLKGARRLPQLRVAASDGVFFVSGPWLGAEETPDRLLVEVWLGRRRVAWAYAPIQTQFMAQWGNSRSSEKT